MIPKFCNMSTFSGVTAPRLSNRWRCSVVMWCCSATIPKRWRRSAVQMALCRYFSRTFGAAMHSSVELLPFLRYEHY
ncbi:hypothetical protein PanWU01x14_202140 [Parasponia andersonii]|uniref:Uncharacterized protein n=1 Tax=Parasponia andersonii TaxID=3476 RepID=A0A2P5BXH4_PARAD|nr:hypothetical protein PanWU01x14_202140 [Parasponia andersonii]